MSTVTTPTPVRKRDRSPIKQRTCIGCRAVVHQHDLVRIANLDGRVVVDLDRSLGTRGAWIHPRSSCICAAERRSQFARAFHGKAELSDQFTQWREEIVRLEGDESSRINPNESG